MKLRWILTLAATLSACNSHVVPSQTEPKNPVNPAATGLIEIQFQGVGTDHPTSAVRQLGPDLARQTLNAVPSGIVFQHLSLHTFTIKREGKRYLTTTYRVTNKTGRTLHNFTLVAANVDDTDGDPTNNGFKPTPGDNHFTNVKYFDGSDASAKAGMLVAGPLYDYDYVNDRAIPNNTGSRFNGDLDLTWFEPFQPTGVTVFPKNFGWVADGDLLNGASTVMTLSVSFPMAATANQDPFSFSFVAAHAEDLGLPEPYNITLNFPQDSGLTEGQKAAFSRAASRWEKVITGGLGDFLDFDLGGGRVLNVDDLEITASAVDIDGPGGVLGQAGPEFVRPLDSLPITGIMRFDRADLADLEASGTLENTILHEMGHVLGIGTVWDDHLVHNGNPDCQAATQVTFTGAQAVQQYRSLGGTGNVPVENQYGAGTKCGHWDEETFDHELMTGFTENSGTMPLSKVTIGALQDLGYTVNMQAAENYSLPGPFQQQGLAAGTRLQEHLLLPLPLPLPRR